MVRERIGEILKRVRPQSSSDKRFLGGGSIIENVQKRMETRMSKLKEARPALLETAVKRLEDFNLGGKIKEILPEEKK